MSECIFCAIAAGDIPCHKVHEDEHTIAFLDIQPLTRGHALVIPKDHASKLEDASAASAAAIMSAAQGLVGKLCAAVGAQDATIAINNGPDAGQEVDHVHVHIVPRTPSDGGGPVHALFAERPHVDGDELARLAAEVLE